MKSMQFKFPEVSPLRAMLAFAWMSALFGVANLYAPDARAADNELRNEVRAEVRGVLRMQVVEDQRVVPPDSSHPPPSAEPADVEQALKQRLAARFVSITGSPSSPLSATQARLAGWGFVSDNAAAIDKNGDGLISFQELDAFMREQMPSRLKQNK